MDVFISWSGERSRRAAEALRAWLPKVINVLKPWMSATDIDKGTRWSTDVAGRLEQSKLGIICLTPGNLHSDWILFEAGALSKTLLNTYVCPLLIGLQPADVKGPLAQFQATRATKEEIRQLLKTINSALGDQSLPEIHFNEAFDVWWPKLEEQFQKLPADKEEEVSPRDQREILEEILALVRNGARNSAAFQRGELFLPIPDDLLNVVSKALSQSAYQVLSIRRRGSDGGKINLVIMCADGFFRQFEVALTIPVGTPPEDIEKLVLEQLTFQVENLRAPFLAVRSDSGTPA